jgi:stearoyl-CoA desaturase (delta-9 desaturase)
LTARASAIDADRGGCVLRHYILIGYVVTIGVIAAGTLWFPFHDSRLASLGVTLGYYALVWMLCGLFLGDVVHLALAHKAMEVKPWFLYLIMILNNTLGCYLNLVSWCNRHRLHHLYADHVGDPNKRPEDGFWVTFYRSQFAYPSIAELTKEPIFSTWPVRLFNNTAYALFSQLTSFLFAWWLVGDWRLALVLWVGIRAIASYVHWIQNFWAHDRRFGTRRHADDDNAMNITHWLPVLLSFSACLQNNHHHAPRFIRLSHSNDEPDWGFVTLRWLYKLGVVTPTEAGLKIPEGADLTEVGL